MVEATWRCEMDRDVTTCVDLTSGATLSPPPWLVFFHAAWMPQRAAEVGLSWDESNMGMVGLEQPVQDDLHFEVADIDTELGLVVVSLNADGQTRLGFFDDTAFVAIAEGEATLDTRARVLTHLSYVVDTFVPPNAAGEPAPLQRRTHISYDLTVAPILP